MAREDKATAVAELADAFRESQGAVLTEYRGLTVQQLAELRRALGGNATYAVVKNTLTKIAAGQAGVEGLDDDLSGPTAIAFITGDPVETAKGLRDFAKAHPLLVIKGGVLDGASMSPDEIRKLADLESREVLLAKLAGAMKASLSNAVSLFNAPLAQTARVLGALQAKAEQDPSVLAGGVGTPAPAQAAPEAEPADEVEAAAPATETEGTVDSAPADDAEAPAPEAPADTAAAVEETPEG
jgi:large subunit ribosomal protein L10